MVAILLLHEAFAPRQMLVGLIRNISDIAGKRLRLLGAGLVYDRARANPKYFNATHWIGHSHAMEHGVIFCDLKVMLEEPDENGVVRFSLMIPEGLLPSFSSAYNMAFVTVSYGLCLHSDTGEVLTVEPVTITQNAPPESARMNQKSRLAAFVTRNYNWYQSAGTAYLAATVDMDEVDNLTAGNTLSLRLHARSLQVKSLRFTVEQRMELSLPYGGQVRRVKQKAVIASSVREMPSASLSEFKKRYFITMPTLCTTISSQIISTQYTVRIQMTSARMTTLSLEIPVTMYHKDSIIEGMPSPLRNPGLDQTWARLIVDSHTKGLADECAICFSEINNSFRPKEAITREEDLHDEADLDSCADLDTDSQCDQLLLDAAEADSEVTNALEPNRSALASPLATTSVTSCYPPTLDIMNSSASEAEACPADVLQHAAADAEGRECAPSARAPVHDLPQIHGNLAGLGEHLGEDIRNVGRLSNASNSVDEKDIPGVKEEKRSTHTLDSSSILAAGRTPDDVAEEIMAKPMGARTKEELQFLYKTHRYRENSILNGIAYSSCGHAFHPLCLLEYEKHSQQRSNRDCHAKCPLCRQTYVCKYFLPDEDLMELCRDSIMREAIEEADRVQKEAARQANTATTQAETADRRSVQVSRMRYNTPMPSAGSANADVAGRYQAPAPAAAQPIGTPLNMRLTGVHMGFTVEAPASVGDRPEVQSLSGGSLPQVARNRPGTAPTSPIRHVTTNAAAGRTPHDAFEGTDGTDSDNPSPYRGPSPANVGAYQRGQDGAGPSAVDPPPLPPAAAQGLLGRALVNDPPPGIIGIGLSTGGDMPVLDQLAAMRISPDDALPRMSRDGADCSHRR